MKLKIYSQLYLSFKYVLFSTYSQNVVFWVAWQKYVLSRLMSPTWCIIRFIHLFVLTFTDSFFTSWFNFIFEIVPLLDYSKVKTVLPGIFLFPSLMEFCFHHWFLSFFCFNFCLFVSPEFLFACKRKHIYIFMPSSNILYTLYCIFPFSLNTIS